MKQNEIFKRIGDIIQELNEQYEYLKTVPDDLNNLELELFVSNAHFLANHIEILAKLNLQNIKIKTPPVEKTETSHEQKYFEPMVQVKQADEENTISPPFEEVETGFANIEDNEEQPAPVADLKTGIPLEPDTILYEEAETIRHELVLGETGDWDDDENSPVENVESTETKQNITAIAVPVEPLNSSVEITQAKPRNDKEEPVTSVKSTQDEILTINQKIFSQIGDKAIARTEELSVKPISDIKLAITLNDKLLYVKELFNGYNLAYSEAIEILNRFNTFEEAMRFLKTNYVTKNNWDSKPAAMEKFYALLKRRYA
ncbi:MAG TPA: hypothetical protein VIM16_11705 [Mucilaginibacter sp.]|jgi:hypothetical protein